MTAGTPSPGPTPSVKRAAKRPRLSPENLPQLQDGFQRKGCGPSFGRFKEGLGGKSKSLPEFFLGIVKGDSFNSERIPLDRQRALAR